MRKKPFLLFVLLLLHFSIMACENSSTTFTTVPTSASTTTTQENYRTDGILGVYTLVSKTTNLVNVNASYIENILWLKDEATIIQSELTFQGRVESAGTYTFEDSQLKVTIGLRTLTFQYNEEQRTITWIGRENRQDVTLVYVKDPSYQFSNTAGEREFSGELFGANQAFYNFYDYAPSIMIEDGVMHIWYCTNTDSNYIIDNVGYRTGFLMADGKWTFSDRELVLAPTIDTWDSRHICDPSVIKGAFSYHGETYSYLMAYLGCVTSNNANNEVGIAVAKSVGGPWIKIVEHNPIANYYASSEYTTSTWTWGYGQPSLVSVDKLGKVLLFYTKGIATGTSTYVEYWDFSSLDHPIKLNETFLSSTSVKNRSGGNDIINNADFAYDPIRNRIYAVKDMNPKPNTAPNFISESVPVMYLDLNPLDSFVGETFFQGTYQWVMHDFITPEISGFPRNHNPGIIRDPYGWLISPNQVPIIYTVSVLNSQGGGRNPAWASLHSYRMYGYLSEVKE